MEVSLLLRGLAIGFLVAVPVGPMGLLCLRRLLVEGRAAGVASGLGMASADTVYGSIAALGLTFVSNFLIRELGWLRLIGGGVLLGLGLKTFFDEPAAREAAVDGMSLARMYVSTFLLTVINPGNTFLFVAIFASLGVTIRIGHYASLAWLLVGMYLGSAVWWLVLAGVASLFHTQLNAQTLKRINHISGLILAGFGLLTLLAWAV